MGALGSFMVADLQWDARLVFAGFSIALVTMGLCSAAAGRLVDRSGGRVTMMAGGVINAAGCALLAAAHTPLVYFIAWIGLGLGMRLSLYDAAFATLASIGGAGAARAIAQITLFGGSHPRSSGRRAITSPNPSAGGRPFWHTPPRRS
jgi:MFS family permease